MKSVKFKLLLGAFALLSALGAVYAAEHDLTVDKCTYEVAVAHLDTQWQWTRNATYNTYIPKTLHDNFSLFASYPTYKFSFNGAFRYWIAEQASTKLFGDFAAADWGNLKKYITAGNWALAGGAIDEIDANMPCIESACRNFLYGQGYYEDRFGKRSLDIYLPDCFGFPYELPTVAVHFGIRGFSSQKFDNWGGWWSPVPNNMTILKWYGPDGNFIYACHKASGYGSNYEVNTAQGNAEQTQSGMWVTYDYYGTGDQGGAPSTAQVSSIANLAGGQASGAYCFMAASDSLFRQLVRMEAAGNADIGRLASYDGEMTMETHGTGCYTHHADVKVRFRNMELGGLSAEPAAVIASKLSPTYTYPQAQIWRAWFKGIDHAFHDDITGTSIHDAYYNSWDGSINDLDSQIVSFGAVKSAANTVVGGLLNTNVSVASAVPVVVYNPLGLDRRDVVQAVVTLPAASTFVKVYDQNGTEVPSQVLSGAGTTSLTILFVAQVPSAGYAVYQVQASAAATTIQTGLSVDGTAWTMTNNDYIVAIDATGDISQITAKKQNNKLLFARASRWELRPDNSSNWPEWEVNRADVMLVTPSSVVDGAPTRTIAESGPVRVSIKVVRNKSNTTYTHYYRLCADSSGSLVTVDNSFSWNSRGNILKAAFYLNVSADSNISSVGVGTIKRPVSGTDRRYESAHQQWQTITDGTSGVAIIDNYKYGASCLTKSNMMLTLVHSPSSTNWSCEGENAYPHAFQYAVYGYAGNWNTNGQVEQQTQRFQLPLTAFQTTAHAGGVIGNLFSFVKVSDPTKIMIMAIKKAGKIDRPEANNDYVVRVREIAGSGTATVSLHFSYNVTSALQTNGMEDIAGATTLTPTGGDVSFSIGKYQLRTLRIQLGTTYLGTGTRPEGQIGSNSVLNGMNFNVMTSGNAKQSVARFTVGASEKVQKVYLSNVRGQVVRTLYTGSAPLASSNCAWDGRDVSGKSSPAGLYVATVVTDKAQKHAPLQLLR